MKRITFHTALFAVCIILFSACKKDNDTVKSREELLTSGQWQLYKLEYDDLSDALPAEDEFKWWDDCDKDDYVQFLTGGTGYQHEGATKCDSDDPDKTTFIWQLQNNDNTLVWSWLPPLTIIKLTDKELTLEFVEDSDKNILYFSKQ